MTTKQVATVSIVVAIGGTDMFGLLDGDSVDLKLAPTIALATRNVTTQSYHLKIPSTPHSIINTQRGLGTSLLFTSKLRQLFRVSQV